MVNGRRPRPCWRHFPTKYQPWRMGAARGASIPAVGCQAGLLAPALGGFLLGTRKSDAGNIPSNSSQGERGWPSACEAWLFVMLAFRALAALSYPLASSGGLVPMELDTAALPRHAFAMQHCKADPTRPVSCHAAQEKSSSSSSFGRGPLWSCVRYLCTTGCSASLCA